MNIALAIMVKTPGYSPLKTRLAKEIGTHLAEGFFRLSVQTIESLVKATSKETSHISPFWSVSEPEAMKSPLWSGFPTIGQGDDLNAGLGDRLHFVYNHLLETHDACILIGADSPQIHPTIFIETEKLLNASPSQFVMGPTEDGGFYLFAGCTPISKKIWNSVAYSTNTTCRELIKTLAPIASTQLLKPTYDIDHQKDLERLSIELPQFKKYLPLQDHPCKKLH